MGFEIPVPVVAAFVASLTAITGFIVNGLMARHSEATSKKQAQYETLISHAFELLHTPRGVHFSKVLVEIEQAWLYASDDVLNRCYEFLEIHKRLAEFEDPIAALKDNEELRTQFNVAIANMYSAMRSDLRNLGRKSNWPTDKVELFPSGVIAENRPYSKVCSDPFLDRPDPELPSKD